MSESAAISTRECIAILDDDASVRKALARLIAACSYRVETYSSAREFIESLNRGVPDCLILDLQMQDITGLELQHYLNGRGTPVPTIVLTAQDEAGTHECCMDAGAVAFLVKPVAKEQLLRAIEAATRHRSPSVEAGENAKCIERASGLAACTLGYASRGPHLAQGQKVLSRAHDQTQTVESVRHTGRT